MQNNNGFTLIELLVTLTLAAILATVAIPSFNRMVRDSQLISQANDLLTTFTYARSEAVRRGMTVSLCLVNGDFQSGTEVRLGSGCVGTLLRVGNPVANVAAVTNFTGTHIPLTAMGLVDDRAIQLPKGSGGEVVDIQVQLSNDTNNRWLCLNRTGHAYVRQESACNNS